MNSIEAAKSQGMINFIEGNYQKAVDSFEKAIQHDSSAQHLLQPWIEKAKSEVKKTP